MSQKDTKSDAKVDTGSGPRPVGLSLSSLFYALIGIYYVAYPLLVQDTTLLPLYIIGVFSILSSIGVMRMARWGLWLGLLLSPLQVILASSALLVVVQPPYSLTSPTVIAFAASFAGLIFLAVLSFLMVLDKRRSFK